MKRPKEAQYRILPGSQALDLRRPKGKERHSSKVLTAAYRRLVEPYYKTHTPCRALFIGHSIPFLVRNTTPYVACILAGCWFRRHGKGQRGLFMGEAIRAANLSGRPQNPLVPRLKTRPQKEALMIATHLSSLGNAEFLLPVRELQMRMLLPHVETARRLLQKLVKLGCLELVEPGLSRPEAAKTGEKARAARYRLAGPRA